MWLQRLPHIYNSKLRSNVDLWDPERRLISYRSQRDSSSPITHKHVGGRFASLARRSAVPQGVSHGVLPRGRPGTDTDDDQRRTSRLRLLFGADRLPALRHRYTAGIRRLGWGDGTGTAQATPEARKCEDAAGDRRIANGDLNQADAASNASSRVVHARLAHLILTGNLRTP